MSKVLAASVQGGKVFVDELEIPDAVIFAEGAGDSEGILILEEFGKFYFANTAPDLKTTLDQLVIALEKTADAITKISTTFTAVGAGMTGPTTAPPPTLATDVAALVTYASAITSAKTQLNTLKGALK